MANAIGIMKTILNTRPVVSGTVIAIKNTVATLATANGNVSTKFAGLVVVGDEVAIRNGIAYKIPKPDFTVTV